jgi:DNA-3-methyladenine glycosylase
MPRRATRTFFRQPPIDLAIALLGQTLVRMLDGQRLAGTIVEVEAYLGVEDRAAHTFGGRRTPRNEAMWMDGGHAYVYFTYGMHHCMNVVAGVDGQPVAVLLRALQPTEGLDIMRRHREKARRDRDLCSGPAKLAQALAVDRSMTGTDLVSSEILFVERALNQPLPEASMVRSPRIGIGYAGDWAARPLRFHLRGNEHVSKP